MDGIESMADISCGDAWYLTENNKPDFMEQDGRNIVFARNKKGNILLEEMYNDNHIDLEIATNYIHDLSYIQKSQSNRRKVMLAQYLAMKIFMKTTPKYFIRV